jgi:hypothetical protein
MFEDNYKTIVENWATKLGCENQLSAHYDYLGSWKAVYEYLRPLYWKKFFVYLEEDVE